MRRLLYLFFFAGFTLTPSVVFAELAGIAPSQESLLVAPPSDHDPAVVGRFRRLAQLEAFEPIERVQGLHVLRKAGDNFIRAICRNGQLVGNYDAHGLILSIGWLINKATERRKPIYPA